MNVSRSLSVLGAAVSPRSRRSDAATVSSAGSTASRVLAVALASVSVLPSAGLTALASTRNRAPSRATRPVTMTAMPSRAEMSRAPARSSRAPARTWVNVRWAAGRE